LLESTIKLLIFEHCFFMRRFIDNQWDLAFFEWYSFDRELRVCCWDKNTTFRWCLLLILSRWRIKQALSYLYTPFWILLLFILHFPGSSALPMYLFLQCNISTTWDSLVFFYNIFLLYTSTLSQFLLNFLLPLCFLLVHHYPAYIHHWLNLTNSGSSTALLIFF